MSLKCIVTGTGRSGTVFMARLLTSLGIPCGHESIFDYEDQAKTLERLANPAKRTLSNCSTHDIKQNTPLKQWIKPEDTVAESSYLAVPHLDLPELRDIPIIHIVRNPIKVITSFVYDFKYFNKRHANNLNIFNELGWENRIYEFLPELHQIRTSIERASHFYCRWNETIENVKSNRPYFFSRIEDLDVDKLCDFLKIAKPTTYFRDSKVNSNHTKDHTFTIPKNTIGDELIRVANKYGYELRR